MRGRGPHRRLPVDLKHSLRTAAQGKGRPVPGGGAVLEAEAPGGYRFVVGAPYRFIVHASNASPRRRLECLTQEAPPPPYLFPIFI